jgi:radical SAM protein with 4Fe4S-binding SPASM domain
MIAFPVRDMPAPRSLVLRTDITNICNLDCVGCGLFETRKVLREPAASMKLEVFEKIANEVFPYLREVALSCEAEPTLHPKFARIMQILGEKTERSVSLPVRMTTNATTLNKDRMDAIFDSGIYGLAVSIDGFTPETFSKLREKGEISKVFEAMDEIVRRRKAANRITPRLQVNYTLMKSNLHELLDLVEYSRRWELENFTVTHVYSPEGKDMRYEFLADWPEETNRILKEAEAKCRKYDIIPRFPAPFHLKPNLWARFASRLRPAPAAAPAPPQETTDLACSAPWNMLKIRWNGDVHPCDLWNFSMPMGNLETQSFRDIWMSEKYVELRSGLAEATPTLAHCLKCDRISQDNLEKRKLQSAVAHTSVSDSVLN